MISQQTNTVNLIFESTSEEKTLNIGKEYAKRLKQGDIVLVKGILGAGKSVFIRGVMRGLGIKEAIPSPTFSLVNEYDNEQYKIYHFDLYRIDEPFELYEIGFEEYIYSNGISFIEWPSKAGELIPQDAIEVTIELKNNKFKKNIRKITIKNITTKQ